MGLAWWNSNLFINNFRSSSAFANTSAIDQTPLALGHPDWQLAHHSRKLSHHPRRHLPPGTQSSPVSLAGPVSLSILFGTPLNSKEKRYQGQQNANFNLGVPRTHQIKITCQKETHTILPVSISPPTFPLFFNINHERS